MSCVLLKTQGAALKGDVFYLHHFDVRQHPSATSYKVLNWLLCQEPWTNLWQEHETNLRSRELSCFVMIINNSHRCCNLFTIHQFSTNCLPNLFTVNLHLKQLFVLIKMSLNRNQITRIFNWKIVLISGQSEGKQKNKGIYGMNFIIIKWHSTASFLKKKTISFFSLQWRCSHSCYEQKVVLHGVFRSVDVRGRN